MSVPARPTGTLATSLAIVADAVEPLSDELSSPERAVALLEELGVDAGTAPASLLALHDRVVSVTRAAAELATALQTGDETSPEALEKLAALATASRLLFDAISRLTQGLRTDFANDPDLLARINLARVARALAEHLLISYVRDHRPVVYNVLLLTGVLEVRTLEAGDDRLPAHVARRLRGDLLRRLPDDAKGVAAEVYGWGTGTFASDVALERLYYLLLSLGLQVGYGEESGDVGATGAGRSLRLPLFAETTEAGAVELGLALARAGATTPDGHDAGLSLEPYATGGSSQSYQLSEGVTLSLEGGLDIEGGLALVLRPPFALELLTGTGSVAGTLAIALDWTPGDGSRLPLASQPNWFRLDVAGFRARLTAGITAAKPPVLGIEGGVVDGMVVLKGSEGDGFLASVLPPEGVTTQFGLQLGWASDRGLYFGGSAGLEITLPVQTTILGILTVHSIYVRGAARDDSANLVVAASFALQLGPVKAAVDRMGIEANLTFPPGGGNLGLAEGSVRFRPPNGAALSIDAGPVTGGGFLFLDADKEQYAGALHLEFEGIALNAVGLLTTRLPDGSPGFSLVVIVTASGFTPVQLGFGFTLNGVGGLLGINRTTAIDVLRAGVRQRTLDAILFSKDDPVPRAPQIVSTLRTVFPPARGRHVFGPMAIIGWGSPTIVTFEVAVLLELPAPIRLIVLGRLRALLPPVEEKFALVKLNMDVLGVIDFDRRELAVDATLYDSFVVGFSVYGDMALRANWGEQPDFALSVGGFHPRARAPTGFPTLRRLTIALATTDNPRLTLQAYLALTSNTVQLGARLDFYVGIAGFSLTGLFSFDTLIQFSPFGFDLEIAAMLALKRDSQTLMGISVQARVTGPSPWHIRGEATFQILFFKITVPVEARFGEERALPPPERVEIRPLVLAAFSDARNWGAELPGQPFALATVRAVAAKQGELLVHPFGELSVRQRVVPFEREIGRFANAPPKDFRRFRVASVRVGTQTLTHVSTTEAFAPAAFAAEMTEDEKLRSPGFDQMPAGARVAAEKLPAKAGPERKVKLEYRTVVLEPPGEPPVEPLDERYTPDAATLLLLSETSAAGSANLRQTGRAKYSTDGDGAIAVVEPEFVVASRAGLAPVVGLPETDGSFSSAREAALQMRERDPVGGADVQIVRSEELRREAAPA